MKIQLQLRSRPFLFLGSLNMTLGTPSSVDLDGKSEHFLSTIISLLKSGELISNTPTLEIEALIETSPEAEVEPEGPVANVHDDSSPEDILEGPNRKVVLGIKEYSGDVSTLEDAVKREKDGKNRTAVIKALLLKIKA